MRLPYGPDTNPVEAFNFEEDVDGTRPQQVPVGQRGLRAGHPAHRAPSPSTAGARPSAAWRAAAWSRACPSHTFKTDEGDVALKCPTEIAITDRREKELSDLGFIPLVHCKGTDYAAFFGAQSAQKPKMYDTDAANANARLSTQLPYILAMSRFAHYLKAMMRDKIGSFMSRTECEAFLNRWITNYVTLDDNASPAVKAQKPLREARIEVSEVAGKPGVYKAVAFLRPHFQLDELTVSLRLVAELPQSTRK